MTLYETIAECLSTRLKLPYARTLAELEDTFANEKELAAFTTQINNDMQHLAPGFDFIRGE